MLKPTALVTGGNKGIGLATSRRFLQEGFRVISVARNFSDVELPKSDDYVCKEFDLNRVSNISELVAELGPIEVLVNNAGLMHGSPYTEYTEEMKREILAVNIESPVALINAVAPSMIERGRGRIVNNASIAGEIGHPDVWYGITKAGVINMTKSYAKILGPNGIVVNAIAAGPVETDMLESIPEARREQIKKAVFTGRFAQPEEVAETIYWLATDCPEYITRNLC